MKVWAEKQTGFTIVELLIVVVVIAILAAITVVSYTGITSRANDTAVQSDLRNLGVKTEELIAKNGTVPSFSELAVSGISLSHGSYGAHYIPSTGQEYNMLRCAASSNGYMYVAASKSGKVFKYLNGTVSEGVGPLTTHSVTCSNNGIGNSGSWVYALSSWSI